jgi:adenosylcobinamide-GDP ribazoletransferase
MKSFWLRLLAAVSMFTRLPAWRLADVPAESYRRVVPLWPLVGWLTGGVMAGAAWVAWTLWGPWLAAVVPLVVRVLLTGALHEDGLADFCDGMGGGSTRERRLAIMKDSHIGTYGVLGLLLYVVLAVLTLRRLADNGVETLMLALFSADVAGKWAAAQLVVFLPYARDAETAKTHLVYGATSLSEQVASLLVGLLPLWVAGFGCAVVYAAVVSVALLLIVVLRRTLRGYTGDCCGAAFLLCELAGWLVLAACQPFFPLR